VQFRWMYSQERELKKLRVIVRNKARVVSRRHSRVKILRTSQASISLAPTT
jgi:hypothetical protein